MTRLAALSALLPLAIALTGCAPGVDARSFQSRVIRSAAPDDVFRAAQVILRREFGPLEIESDARRLVSRRVEYRTTSDSGSARDLYGGRSTMRRIARFSVGQRGDGAVARLGIDVERLDTARREAFQPDRYRLTDAPSQTPIERDAATSTRQNTVWTFVKRDLRFERALLAELQERFARPPEQPDSVSGADETPREAP
jgi:hypothetical protein